MEPKWQLAKVASDATVLGMADKLIWTQMTEPAMELCKSARNGRFTMEEIYVVNIAAVSPNPRYQLSGISASSVELLGVFAEEVSIFGDYDSWVTASNKEIFETGKIIGDVSFESLNC